MSKKIVVSLRLHKKPTTRPPMDFVMPEGCVGMMFAFENKQMAKKFDGKDMDYVNAEIKDKDNED